VTLLEKARAAARKDQRRQVDFSLELIALAVAWARGEVSTLQASVALNCSRNNAQVLLAGVIRKAVSAGLATLDVSAQGKETP
jgi:hypothetical protein